MTTAMLPRRRRPTGGAEHRVRPMLGVAPDQLREETRQLLATEIDFVPSAEFRQPGIETEILGADGQRLEQLLASSSSKPPADLPSHLAALCQTNLLSADAERELFRALNFLKYRANVLRATLDPQSPCPEAVAAVKGYLAQAGAVRDHLLLANMRLVVSIVKNFVSPRHSFDDMLSEGVVSLMQAVDKFNFERGFRFSTYAYRAICRNALRMISQQKRETARFGGGGTDPLADVAGEGDPSAVAEQRWFRLRESMKAMLEQLDRRERFIIRGRFALGGHRRVSTFQCLADKLGVSKERVRQLEQRALLKLQHMAQSAHLHELHELLLGQQPIRL